MNRSYWIAVGGLALGLVLMLGVGWRFFVLPLRAEYADTMAQKQDIEQQLETARATAAQFGKFKTQAEQMRRNLEFYEARTDAPLDPVAMISGLESLGNADGLDELQVVLVRGRPQAGGALGQAHLDLHFDGDFNRVGQFLNACVSQKAIVVPTHISLNNYIDSTGLYQDTLTVGLDLMVYGAAPKGGR